MGTGELLGNKLQITNYWGVTCDGLTSRRGGVEILIAASCFGKRDKLRPDESVGSKGFTFNNLVRYHNNLLQTRDTKKTPKLQIFTKKYMLGWQRLSPA